MVGTKAWSPLMALGSCTLVAMHNSSHRHSFNLGFWARPLLCRQPYARNVLGSCFLILKLAQPSPFLHHGGVATRLGELHPRHLRLVQDEPAAWPDFTALPGRLLVH